MIVFVIVVWILFNATFKRFFAIVTNNSIINLRTLPYPKNKTKKTLATPEINYIKQILEI